MSVETISQDEPYVRDAFLELAHTICVREQKSLHIFNRMTLQWIPDESVNISEGISLRKVHLGERAEEQKFTVISAEFMMGGSDTGTSVMIAKGNQPEAHEDDFTRDLLDEFRGAYHTHEHALCIRAVRLRRQNELERERILKPSTGELRIVDKRRVHLT